MLKKIALAAVFLVTPAAAEPSGDANPEYAPFYRALKSPATGGGCCSEADCRPAEHRTKDNIEYEVFFDKRSFGPTAPDAWVKIPAEIIIHRPPVGLQRPQEAVACWYRNQPYCFTPPAFGG